MRNPNVTPFPTETCAVPIVGYRKHSLHRRLGRVAYGGHVRVPPYTIHCRSLGMAYSPSGSCLDLHASSGSLFLDIQPAYTQADLLYSRGEACRVITHHLARFHSLPVPSSPPPPLRNPLSNPGRASKRLRDESFAGCVISRYEAIRVFWPDRPASGSFRQS